MSNPIGEPRIVQHSHVQGMGIEKPKSQTHSHPPLLENPPFPSLSSTQTLSGQADRFDQLLAKELDEIIEKKEVQVNDHFADIDQAVKDQKLVRSFIEVGKWAHEYADTGKEIVQSGVEFLEFVLPKQYLTDDSALKKSFDDINQITSDAGKYLNALDLGLTGLALIYKSKILATSKKVLAKLKEEHKEMNKPPELGKHIKDWQSNLKKAEKTLSYKELRKFEKAMNELDIKLKIEGKDLEAQQTRYGLRLTKTALSFLKIPLKLLPIDTTLTAFKFLSGGLSAVTTALGIILSSLVLHKAVERALIFKSWTQGFQQWQQRHQPVIDKTASNETKASTVKDTSPSIDKQPMLSGGDPLKKREEELLRLIHRHGTIQEVRNLLKNFGIELNSAIQTTDLLLENWHTDPVFRQELVANYASFQQVLESFDSLIQTSQSLLDKRRVTAEKKVFLLKPHFQDLLPKIKEIKRSEFNKLLEQFRQDAANPAVALDELKQQAARLHLPVNIKPFNPHPYDLKLNRSMRVAEGRHIIIALDRALKKEPNGLFERFIANESSEKLIGSYIDHQETIELTTKNALKEMVAKKHQLEKGFIRFQLTESSVFFTLGLISSAVSVTLAIIGLATTPVAGAGFIFLGLSVASTALSLGFLGAGYYYAYRKKPESFKASFQGVGIKSMLNNVMAKVEEYRLFSKKKKLQQTAEILQVLHQNPSRDRNDPKFQKAFLAYEQSKIDYAASLSKVEKWTQMTKNLQNRLDQASWKDFAQAAALKIGEDPQAFDTLRAFNEALQASDLRLISPETKSLLEAQLGLDIEALQAAAGKDPSSVKKALQKFFTLDDSGFVNFIRYQQERIKAGMIPSLLETKS